MAKAEVLVRFTVDSLLSDAEAMAEGFTSFADAVRFLIQEDGLLSLVDDDYEIVEIKELP